MSTISVACSKRLAELHAAHGQVYVAAPVFGRPVAAAAAKLWIVAAGPRVGCRTLPTRVSTRSGARLFGGRRGSLARQCGQALRQFPDCRRARIHGRGVRAGAQIGCEMPDNSWILSTTRCSTRLFTRTMAARDCQRTIRACRVQTELGFKDLRLVQEAAEAAAVPMPFAGVLRDHFLAALARGESDLDWAAVARIAAVQAGL